jgi:hypothetical protein
MRNYSNWKKVMNEYVFISSVGALLGAAVFWSGYFCAMKKTKSKWNVKKTDDLYANSASIEFPFEMPGLKDCPNLNVPGQVILQEEWDTWRTRDSTGGGRMSELDKIRKRHESVSVDIKYANQRIKDVDYLLNHIKAVRNENERMTNLLEDVVSELDLSESAIEQHGPMGTAPAELVALVLAEKDLKIAALKAGLIPLAQEAGG